MIIERVQKAGLDFEDAIDVESVSLKDLAEIDPAALGAVNDGIGIDPANAGLDRRKDRPAPSTSSWRISGRWRLGNAISVGTFLIAPADIRPSAC